MWETSRNKLKSILLPEIVLTFHCLKKLFKWSWPSASNFKSFSWSVEQFFLIIGQNNFGNKIPLEKNKQKSLSVFTWRPINLLVFTLWSSRQALRRRFFIFPMQVSVTKRLGSFTPYALPIKFVMLETTKSESWNLSAKSRESANSFSKGCGVPRFSISGS